MNKQKKLVNWRQGVIAVFLVLMSNIFFYWKYKNLGLGFLANTFVSVFEIILAATFLLEIFINKEMIKKS